MASVSSVPLENPARVSPSRLVSLDVFRGITIAFDHETSPPVMSLSRE